MHITYITQSTYISNRPNMKLLMLQRLPTRPVFSWLTQITWHKNERKWFFVGSKHKHTLTWCIRTALGPFMVHFEGLQRFVKLKPKSALKRSAGPTHVVLQLNFVLKSFCKTIRPRSTWRLYLFFCFFNKIPQVLTALWSLTAGWTGFGSCGETAPCVLNRSWRRRCCWGGDLCSDGSSDTYSATFSLARLEPAKLDG